MTYGTEVRKVLVSRGNRAGNNAFLEDSPIEENSFRSYLSNEYFKERLVHMPDLKWDHVKKLMDIDTSMRNEVEMMLRQFMLAGRVDIA